MLTLLNTSILTAHGAWDYQPVSLVEARKLVASRPWQSAIGHDSTAAILTELLGVEVPVARIQYQQGPDDLALVFKLRGRPPEGAVLSVAEIEAIGYDFGTIVAV